MRIHFLSSGSEKARQAYAHFTSIYGQTSVDEADVIVTLSGDGTIIKSIHENLERGIPIYAMNCGKVGFLANELNIENNLIERIKKSYEFKIYPLEAVVKTAYEEINLLAVNEIYLFRNSYQALKIEVSINGIPRAKEIVCDGILTTSSIGSTAYSLSFGGPIIPISADLISLVGMGVFSPKNWHNALIDGSSVISIDILNFERRPALAVADYIEAKNVRSISIRKNRTKFATLLLDNENSLSEKIITEQFR